MNEALRKFGYPGSLVKDYELWSVLLRPQQATLGALVVVCKEPVLSFGAVSAEGFAELGRVSSDLEHGLNGSFRFQKLNYLMLMMVDPDVHFHVLPRYSAAPSFSGLTFEDPGWPGPPALGNHTPTDEPVQSSIKELLRANWPQTH